MLYYSHKIATVGSSAPIHVSILADVIGMVRKNCTDSNDGEDLLMITLT